jgi:carbonic anhydrase
MKPLIAIILTTLCLLYSVNGSYNYLDQTAGDWSKSGSVCLTGVEQSPIDFGRHTPYQTCEGVLQVIDFRPLILPGATLTVAANGLTFSGLSGTTYIAVNNYEFIYHLSWCEFHLPSEHTIDGDNYDAELQCYFTQNVIAPPAGSVPLINAPRVNYFAVSVLFKKHDYKTDFSELSDFKVGNSVPIFDLKKLFNMEDGFYHYYGSETNPDLTTATPCLEDVLWAVMGKPLKISDKQFYFLKESLVAGGFVNGMNERLTQQLNKRAVYTCRREESTVEETHHHFSYISSDSLLDDDSSSTSSNSSEIFLDDDMFSISSSSSSSSSSSTSSS